MTGIPPTLPPVSVPAALPAVVTATPVAQVPPPIANLPPNSVIDATVVAALEQAQQAQQARSIVQLVTALGNVSVRLPFPIPANAALTLQLVGTGANLAFRVIAINGQPIQGGLPPGLAETPTTGATLATGTWTAGAATAATAATESRASALNSFLPPTSTKLDGAAATDEISAPSIGARAAGIPATVVFGSQPGWPTGTQLILRLLGVESPPTQTGVANAQPGEEHGGTATAPGDSETGSEFGQSGGGNLGKPAIETAGQPQYLVPGGSGAPESPETEAAPTGTGGQAGVQGPGTASASSPPTAGPTNAPTGQGALVVPDRLSGVVAPNSLAGKPLIQTPLGLIALETAPDLPPGARVLLETVGNPVPPQAAPAAAAPSTAAGQPATGWSSFTDAIAVLQKADPAVAQMLVQRLPDLSPQFMLNAAGWVAAAETGNMRAWLGDRATKALENAGRADLIERLEGDMGEMRASVTLPQGAGDWQVLTMPLFFEQRIERIRLTMRRQRGQDDDAGRSEEGLRFLVDVDMSRLGALQFDGLVKRNAKSFDLIVRSRQALPDEVRREIAIIFARALDNMGMIGAAVFKQAVAFVEPVSAHPAGTGVIT